MEEKRKFHPRLLSFTDPKTAEEFFKKRGTHLKTAIREYVTPEGTPGIEIGIILPKKIEKNFESIEEYKSWKMATTPDRDLYKQNSQIYDRREDISENIRDMKYAERLILDPTTLEAMANIKLGDIGSIIIVDIKELRREGYKGNEFGSAVQKFDSMFVAMEIPFKVGTYNVVDGRLVLGIFRYGEKFGKIQYACKGGRRNRKTKKWQDYEEPTVGVRFRFKNWIKQNWNLYNSFIERLHIEN